MKKKGSWCKKQSVEDTTGTSINDVNRKDDKEKETRIRTIIDKKKPTEN